MAPCVAVVVVVRSRLVSGPKTDECPDLALVDPIRQSVRPPRGTHYLILLVRALPTYPTPRNPMSDSDECRILKNAEVLSLLSQAGKKKTPSSPPASTPSSPPKRKRRFQLNTKTLFLTYPQNETSKETAMERIVEAWKPEWAIVCQESHQDGNHHLHACVRLPKPINFKSASFADFVAGAHGNYATAKGISASIKYVKKAGNWCVHGVLPENQKSNREAPTTKVAKMIMAGKTLQEIKVEEPGTYLMHRNKIQDMMQEEASIAANDSLLPWRPLTLKPSMSSHKEELVLWLNQNIDQHREFKKKQLWLVGPPGVGKTTMILWLAKFQRIYWVPMEESFYDEYYDERIDLCVFDEYKAHKTITFMNMFLQGMCPIRKKGSQYLKQKNTPCIILSNYSPEECYSKSDQTALAALRERINVVYWPAGEFIDLSDCVSSPSSTPVVNTPILSDSDSDSERPLKRTRAFIDSDSDDDLPPLKRRKACPFIDDEAICLSDSE